MAIPEQALIGSRTARQHLLPHAQICARPAIAQCERLCARWRLAVTHPSQIERLVAAQFLRLLNNERLGYFEQIMTEYYNFAHAVAIYRICLIPSHCPLYHREANGVGRRLYENRRSCWYRARCCRFSPPGSPPGPIHSRLATKQIPPKSACKSASAECVPARATSQSRSIPTMRPTSWMENTSSPGKSYR